MKKLKKGLVIAMAALMMFGSIPVRTAYAGMMDTTNNETVISTGIAKGKIGRSMSVSFTIRNNSGSDWENVKVAIANSGGYISDSSSLEDDYVFPFEVTNNTFTERSIGPIKSGKSRSASVSAKVRSDIKEGYYTFPVEVRANDGTVAEEYVNIWVTVPKDTDEEDKEKTAAFVMGENQSTPYGVYPNVLNYNINLRNSGLVGAKDVTVSMVLSKDSAEFPFDINDGNYDRTFEKIDAGETVSVPYSMAIREDTYSGYYPIKFNITYRNAADSELKTEEEIFYVRVRNKDKDDTTGDFDKNNRKQARLVVDSFETNPSNIIAGESFELVLRMKNASASIPASNILFALESEKDSENGSAVFSTESGSSAIAVNSMAPGEVTELRVNMQSKAGVAQRTYALTIKETYDSPEYKNAVESVVIDIPLRQIARLNTGTIEVMPESITVGSESNIMFPINNTGKVILYNVMVTFEADSIKPTDTYVGNIEPGKTGNVDVMLSGMAPTTDDGKIKMNITYEDENGEVQPAVSKELSLYVTEEIPMDFGDMEAGNFEDMGMEEPSFFQKYKMIIFPAIAVVVVAVVVVIRIRKKKKAAKEEGMDDEIS
ncbi:MAG: hypothetical protein KHZ58_14455 [Hungatella hathewayi]|nr:hypothetical protein [Hungatella hathewayi]